MIPIEVYEHYKARIDRIKRFQDRLAKVEAVTDINGMHSIDSVEELVKLSVESTKAFVAFLKEPFEPATLDNYEAQYYECGSQMQVFKQTPSKFSFDARKIFDAERLSIMVAEIFRAVTLIQFALPKKIPVPQFLSDTEKILNEIVGGLYTLFTPGKLDLLEGEECTFTGYKSAPSPLITFVELPEQKYFTDEERAEINKREQEKQKAIAIAKEKAAIESESDLDIEHMKKFDGFYDCGERAFEKLKSEYGELLAKGFSALVSLCYLMDKETCMANILRNSSKYNDTQVVLQDGCTITVKDVAYANRLIKAMQTCGMVRTVKDMFFRSDYKIYGASEEDFLNALPIGTDTIITFYSES